MIAGSSSYFLIKFINCTQHGATMYNVAYAQQRPQYTNVYIQTYIHMYMYLYLSIYCLRVYMWNSSPEMED